VAEIVSKRLATHLIELLKASHCPQLLVIKSVLGGGAVEFNEAHYTHPSLHPGRRHPVRKSVNKYSRVKNSTNILKLIIHRRKGSGSEALFYMLQPSKGKPELRIGINMKKVCSVCQKIKKIPLDIL
jgi:hypothetical protein